MKYKSCSLLITELTYSVISAQPASLDIVNLDLVNNCFDVEVSTTIDITGIQLTITGVELTEVQFPQGPWYWMMYSANLEEGFILAWTFDTPPIPPGTFTMLTVSFSAFEDTELCLEDFAFSTYYDGWTIDVADCCYLDYSPFIDLGDINEDGFVDIFDIIVFVNIITMGDEPDSYTIFVLDINEDGFMDVLDIVLLVDIILGPSLFYLISQNAWQLDHFSMPPVQLTIPDDQNYILNFYLNGNYDGQWDCNIVWGEYSMNPPDEFDILWGWTTLLYCGDESYDETLSMALMNVDRITIVEDNLTLTNDLTGAALVFIAAP